MSPYRSPADMPKETRDIPRHRNVVVPDGARPTDLEALRRESEIIRTVAAVVIALCFIALGVAIGLAIAPSLGC